MKAARSAKSTDKIFSWLMPPQTERTVRGKPLGSESLLWTVEFLCFVLVSFGLVLFRLVSMVFVFGFVCVFVCGRA